MFAVHRWHNELFHLTLNLSFHLLLVAGLTHKWIQHLLNIGLSEEITVYLDNLLANVDCASNSPSLMWVDFLHNTAKSFTNGLTSEGDSEDLDVLMVSVNILYEAKQEGNPRLFSIH